MGAAPFFFDLNTFSLRLKAIPVAAVFLLSLRIPPLGRWRFVFSPKNLHRGRKCFACLVSSRPYGRRRSFFVAQKFSPRPQAFFLTPKSRPRGRRRFFPFVSNPSRWSQVSFSFTYKPLPLPQALFNNVTLSQIMKNYKNLPQAFSSVINSYHQ